MTNQQAYVTLITSETAEPRVSHQSPPTALPSIDERKLQMSLFGVLGYMVAAATGNPIIVVPATACAQPRDHEAEAEKSGNGVEGALRAAKGIRAGVGRWGKDTEELATEAVLSLQERKRVKDQPDELCKKKERLAAENERLSKEVDEVIAEAVRQGVESSHSLWVEARRLSDCLDKMEEEEQGARVEVERVGKQFNKMEQETEDLVRTLALVIDGGDQMGIAARVVAAARRLKAGVKVEVDEVEVDDVKAETECAEEVARGLVRPGCLALGKHFLYT